MTTDLAPQTNGLAPEAPAAPFPAEVEYLSPAERVLFAAAQRDLHAARQHFERVWEWLAVVHQQPGTRIGVIDDAGRIVRVAAPEG